MSHVTYSSVNHPIDRYIFLPIRTRALGSVLLLANYMTGLMILEIEIDRRSSSMHETVINGSLCHDVRIEFHVIVLPRRLGISSDYYSISTSVSTERRENVGRRPRLKQSATLFASISVVSIYRSKLLRLSWYVCEIRGSAPMTYYLNRCMRVTLKLNDIGVNLCRLCRLAVNC